METEYVKRAGKVFRREIQEEEYDVEALISMHEAQVAALQDLKTNTIDKLK